MAKKQIVEIKFDAKSDKFEKAIDRITKKLSKIPPIEVHIITKSYEKKWWQFWE